MNNIIIKIILVIAGLVAVSLVLPFILWVFGYIGDLYLDYLAWIGFTAAH